MAKETIKLRATPNEAQQYVRGKTATDRVVKAGDAVQSTRNTKAQQMLLRAQRDEMSPDALKANRKSNDDRQKRYLAEGRKYPSLSPSAGYKKGGMVKKPTKKK